MKDFVSFFITTILITTIYIHFENKVKEVEYITSEIDNRDYLVQNHPDKKKAANLLATIRNFIYYT